MAKKSRRAATAASRTGAAPARARSDGGTLARYRSVIVGIVAAVGLVALAFLFMGSAQAGTYTCESLLTPPPAASSDPGALGFETTFLGQTHVPAGSSISYGFCPPTSGNHYPVGNSAPLRPAVYGATNEQQPGGWVHNLEHGSVVVLYRCPSGILGSGDCATEADVQVLREWFDNAPVVPTCGKQAVVARFDSMSTRFAVLAWNRALLLDDFDLVAASHFAQQWTDVNAPEAPAC